MTSQDIIYADWDEMLFTDREKMYGAYELRKSYPRNLRLAVFLMCGAMLLFIVNASWSREPEQKGKIITLTPTNEKLLPPPEEKPEPPIELPPPPPPPAAPQIRHAIPLPVEEDLAEDSTSIASITELNEAPAIGFSDVEGDGEFDWGEIDGDAQDIPEVVSERNAEEEGMIIFPDELPKVINMNEVARAIDFPEAAKQLDIKGQVIIRVRVDAKGRYESHKVLKSVHPILTKAVEPHLSKLRFTPAIQGGNPISFFINIPFKFETID